MMEVLLKMNTKEVLKNYKKFLAISKNERVRNLF